MAIVTGVEAGLRAAARGATILQLRDPAATARGLEERARALVAATKLPIVVNARVDVALAVGAAGVHLPERDLPVGEVRRLMPNHVVGRSVHSVAAARDAAWQGADYVVFGPVFSTPSHPGQPGAGLDALHDVAAAVRIPVIAIGGVDASRERACREAGAAGIAAIRYFQQ